MGKALQYAGKRLIGSRLKQLFMDGDKATSFNGLIKSVYIGDWYAWDGKSMKTRPEKVDKPEDVKQSMKWRAEEAVALEEFRDQMVRKKFERDKKDVSKELDKLAEMAAGVQLFDLDKFARFIARELFERRTKRTKPKKEKRA